MVKSNTKISKQLGRKKNPDIVETIIAAKKNKEWKEVAEILSSSRKNRPQINIEDINEKIKDEKIVVIPGKVLSLGEIDKKIKVVAFSFSEKAEQKLLKAKCEVSSIIEEIKKNPEAKGIKILKEK